MPSHPVPPVRAGWDGKIFVFRLFLYGISENLKTILLQYC